MLRSMACLVLVLQMLVGFTVVGLIAPRVGANQVGIGAFSSAEQVFEFEDGVDVNNVDGNSQITLSNNNVASQSGSFTTIASSTYYSDFSGPGTPSGQHVFASGPDTGGNIDVNFDPSLAVNGVGLFLDNKEDNTTFNFTAFGPTAGINTPQDGPFSQTITNGKDGIFAGISTDSPITRFNITWDNGESLVFDNLQYTVVPEPTSLLLAGLGGLLIFHRRRGL